MVIITFEDMFLFNLLFLQHTNLTSGVLPEACKSEARYARIIIMSLKDTDETKSIGVR